MERFLRTYQNKVIVIAGGTSGMGESVVRLVSPHAKIVIILGRNQKAGKRLVEALDGYVIFKHVEMKDDAAVSRALREVHKQYGAIDFFFNFAGTFLAGEIRDTPIEDWRLIFDNNILPIANGTSAAYELMRSNGYGHIINVASAAGLFPVPIMNIYGATKSAVVSLTLGLRAEARNLGVKVSVVCPTVVKTPLYDTAVFDGIDKKKSLSLLENRSNIQMPDVAAIRILKAVTKNRGIIHTSFMTRLGWALYRFSPSLYLHSMSRFFKVYRNTLRLK